MHGFRGSRGWMDDSEWDAGTVGSRVSGLDSGFRHRDEDLGSVDSVCRL